MVTKKFLSRALSALIIGGSLFSTSIVDAEIRNYDGVGEYVMSDFETPEVARQRAKARAEQSAQEQAGVFVDSYTKVINQEVTEDEITIIARGIIKVLDVQYYRELLPGDEGTLYRATIKAAVDTDNVDKWLNKSVDERQTINSQLEILKKSNADQERQIAALKAQLANATTAADKEKLTQAFAAEDKIFLSNQKVEEGWKLYFEGDYIKALDLFDEAVKLNPNNAEGYFGKGIANDDLQNYQQAIYSFNKYIELNPNYGYAYYNRGIIYKNLGQYEQAISDYSQAIKFNPKSYQIYNNRGTVYAMMGKYNQAINDFSKSIKINPKYESAYYNRGNVCYYLGKYKTAVEEFTKAIELNPNNAEAYNNRGFCYQKLGDEAKAKADFAKANEING